MRIQFKASYADNLAFQQAYHREFEKEATPAWFRVTSGFLLLVAIIAFGNWLLPETSRLFAFYFGALLIAWLWTLAYSRGYRFFAARYLKDSEVADTNVVELVGGRFSSENRGIMQSFPLSAVSAAYERDDFIYVYFGRLGAARLPFSAFESADQRRAFLTLVTEGKEGPNQSLEPTTMAVTAPAAQAPRQP